MRDLATKNDCKLIISARKGDFAPTFKWVGEMDDAIFAAAMAVLRTEYGYHKHDICLQNPAYIKQRKEQKDARATERRDRTDKQLQRLKSERARDQSRGLPLANGRADSYGKADKSAPEPSGSVADITATGSPDAATTVVAAGADS